MSKKPTITLYHVQKEDDLKKHKAIAVGNSIALQTINIAEEPLTPRRLYQLSNQFDGGLRGLLNEESERFQKKLEGHDYSDQELLKILVKKPQMLKLPILELENKTHICTKARDILKFSSSSANINAYNHDENVSRS